MTDTGGILRKTTHQTISHAPASIADYNLAFSPNTASGGWHRGDGCFSTHGAGWSLFSFNDFYVSDGAGGVQALFRRNAVLMVDTATGLVSWLSSGDQFPLPGAVTFPGPGDTSFCWLKGGWPTGASSAILLAGRWSTGLVEQDIRVMGIAGFTGASPTCTAVTTTDLPVTVRWSGQPWTDQGYVYLYGFKTATLTHHVARHAYSTDPADYATGWTYWDGSSWASSLGAGLTISNAGLASLNVRPWVWGYLATAKVFDTAPEIAIPDVWPDVNAWWSPTPQGPWWWIGHVYTPTTVDTWYSYLARLEYLPGLSGPVALWSLNKTPKTVAEIALYGPNLAPAIPPAGGHGTVTASSGAAGGSTVETAAAGATTAAAVRAGTAVAGQSPSGSATAGHSG